jgi:mRNA interferase MazF
MKRGDIWTIAAGGGYGGKPRPAVIVQDDRFAAMRSVTVCPFTGNAVDVPILRVLVEPSAANGLKRASRVMVDKVITVPKTKMGTRIGALAAADLVRLDRALMVFLGLAG